MITGFGNNVISSLAADITAGQTTIQVMPGTGAKFAGLLSSDYANASNPLQTYAKITLTDAKETVFEICHLTSVNNDVLTVVRGQEGTTEKGWALNDVIANFATRGSENQFVQIEQLQSGNYISGIAGGTANALTLELPATYFVNGATDWTLRTPIVVFPTQNNTGASTLQLTMGGRVLGTFKLYKGNKAELVANDILKDAGLVCLLDNTKTFFNVMNPGAIYAGLGTAAFKDVVTTMTDVTPGRVPVVGWMGVGTSAQDSAAGSSHVSRFMYEPFQPGTLYPDSVCIIQSGGPTATEWGQIAVSYGTNFRIFAGHGTYNNSPEITEFYHDKRKPTASDVGAYPITGGTLNGNMSATGSVTSGPAKDISSGQDIWAGRDLYAQRNASITGNIDAGGYIRSGVGNDVVSQRDIWASRYIYENGQRVYSPNNPPPNKFSSALNTISWEKNLETGVIRQWGFIDVGDNSYTTVNLPIAFPSSFLALTVTPAMPGAFMGTDVCGAGGKIINNSSFGCGMSSNVNIPWSGVYFEAIGV